MTDEIIWAHLFCAITCLMFSFIEFYSMYHIINKYTEINGLFYIYIFSYRIFDLYSKIMNFHLCVQPIKTENVAPPNDLKKEELKTSTELTSEPQSKKLKENEPTEIRSPEPIIAVKVESEPIPITPGKFRLYFWRFIQWINQYFVFLFSCIGRNYCFSRKSGEEGNWREYNSITWN